MKQIKIYALFAISLAVACSPTLHCAPPPHIAAINHSSSKAPYVMLFVSAVSFIAAGYQHWKIRNLEKNFPLAGTDQTKNQYEQKICDRKFIRDWCFNVGVAFYIIGSMICIAQYNPV